MESDLIAEVQEAIVAAEELIARWVARGSGELMPLLGDIRALLGRPVDARLRKQVDELGSALPYWEDKGQTWIPRDDPTFLARLRAAGTSFGETDYRDMRGIDAALHRIGYVLDRSLRLDAHPVRPNATVDSGPSAVDVGRHRLYFLGVEQGGGFIIDDGWHVPLGAARAAITVPAGERDYVLVDTAACPVTRSPGGLCLVDAQRYEWSRVTPSPVDVAAVTFVSEGLRIAADPPILYTSLSFSPCRRR